jgi:plasmid stabilization system protein ParE
MPNVIQISEAAERRAARVKRKKEEASSAPDEPDGLIQFTRTAHGDRMSITGVYADRLQAAAYALVNGLKDTVEMLAESGTIGSFNCGPIRDHPLPRPPEPRSTPRRLREETDFGGLK